MKKCDFCKWTGKCEDVECNGDPEVEYAPDGHPTTCDNCLYLEPTHENEIICRQCVELPNSHYTQWKYIRE